MNLLSTAALLVLGLAPLSSTTTVSDPSDPSAGQELEVRRLTAELLGGERARGVALYEEQPERRSLTVRIEAQPGLEDVELEIQGHSFPVPLGERGRGEITLRAHGGEGLAQVRAGDPVVVLAGGERLLLGVFSRQR